MKETGARINFSGTIIKISDKQDKNKVLCESDINIVVGTPGVDKMLR